MAKRGRPPLPFDRESWLLIYQEVWDLIAPAQKECAELIAAGQKERAKRVKGNKLTEAWREVGLRHGLKWQVVRDRCKRMEEHHLSVRRFAERANRGLKRSNKKN